MLKAAKKNRVLKIPDEKVEEYKKLGYKITALDGTVIYEPENATNKIMALGAEIIELNERLSEAEAENAELKRKIAELEAATPKKTAKASK